MREALLIAASFLLFFFCLIIPDTFAPWAVGGAVLLLAAGLWGLFAPPSKTALREIHCLRGTPRRWGLFGENDQEQINNISLGIIDLIYPLTGNLTSHRILASKRISIFISIAMLSAVGVFIPA